MDNSQRKSFLGRLMARLMARVLDLTKNDLNIRNLREKYGASGNNVIQIDVYRKIESQHPIFSGRYFVTDDGVANASKDAPVTAVSTIDYDTILYLIKGSRKVSKDGHLYTEPFGFLDAYGEGLVTIERKSSYKGYLGDIQLLNYLYDKILPALRDTVGKYV